MRLDCFLKNMTWQRPITPKSYLVRRHWQNGIVLPNQYFWLGPWSFNFMISLFLSFRIASEYACVLDQPGRLSRFKWAEPMAFVGMWKAFECLRWHGRRPDLLPLTVMTIRRQAWGASILQKKGELMHLRRLLVTHVFIYCWLLDCETTTNAAEEEELGGRGKLALM